MKLSYNKKNCDVIELNMNHKTILVFLSFSLLIATFTVMNNPIQAEEIPVTLVDEGFEDGIPENWENTGWILNWYGFPHSGSNWISASAAGTILETPALTFGENTELSFWYAVEENGTPLSMEVIVNSTIVWSKNVTNRDYQQALIDLNDYNNQTQNITFNCTTSQMFVLNIDDIVVTTYSDDAASDDDDDTPTSDDDDDTSPGGGGGGIIPPENKQPYADVSAGLPYDGIAGESILFDGSASKDGDGNIVSWDWDFDDGTTGTGETVSHTFSEPGFYQVSLTVTDDDGATNTTTVQSDIGRASIPPSKPELKLPPDMPLELNTTYSFHVVSTDEDNDDIKYEFDWGDGTTFTSDFVSNNTKKIVNHSWPNAGRYIVSVTAIDKSNSSSQTTTEIVLVDVTVLSIDNEIKGVLIDYNRTGEFDVFYNQENGQEIIVEKTDEFTYLIDANDDGNWDYEYSLKSGLISYGSDSSGNDTKDDNQTDNGPESESPGFELLLLITGLLFLLVLHKRKDD